MDTPVSSARTVRVAERVAAQLGTLSPAERRVAQFFAAHPEETAFETAAEIARMAGSSDATVIRTARTLGFAGLPELKRALIEELRVRLTPATRLGHSLEWIGHDPAAVLDHMLDLQLTLLEEARHTVRKEDFHHAVTLLHNAERVLTCGFGPHASLADYVTLRLRRIGRQALALTSTGFLLGDVLLCMRSGDVLVLMAYGRLYREIEVTLARAREADVPVVLLTDTLAAAVQPAAALTASCRHGGLHSSIAPTAVLLEALLLGVAARDRPRSLATMRQLNDLWIALGGDHAEPMDPSSEADDHRHEGAAEAMAAVRDGAAAAGSRRRRRPSRAIGIGRADRLDGDARRASDGTGQGMRRASDGEEEDGW